MFRYSGRDAPSGGGTDFDLFINKTLTLRFDGFALDENGQLKITRGLDDSYRFEEREGRVYAKGSDTPVANPATYFVDRVRLRLAVVSPMEITDEKGTVHDVYGQVLSLGLKVKGIRAYDDLFEITSVQTGLMRAMIALGFSWALAGEESPHYDPTYVMSRLEAGCTVPLSVDSVICGVFYPILSEAADAGRYVVGKTNKDNAFFAWSQTYGFLDAVTDPVVIESIEEQIAARVKADEVPIDPPLPPFPGDEPKVGISPDDMEKAIRAAVMEGTGELKGADTSARLDELYRMVLVIEPTFTGKEKILQNIAGETLAPLYDVVCGKSTVSL